jgi:predicted dehydrogenase
MLKIAQIGVGYWGPNILRNLVENKRCSVTAAVDLALERRDYVHRLYPAIKVTENIDEALQDRETDAVVIATPVASHFDLAMRALESGKHVLVEKPLARVWPR